MKLLDYMIQELPKGYITYEAIMKIEKQYIKKYKNKLQYRKDCKSLKKERILRNEQFMKQEQLKAKSILENVKGYALDKEQIRAVLTEEKYNLVIAGAGSGKSLTIVGKIRYLVEIKKIECSQILCISFTNDATNSLKNTLLKYYNYNLDILTFHKLALKILKKNGGKIKIADDQFLEKIVENYIKKVFFEEKKTRKWICQHFFHSNFKKTFKNVNNMKSFPQVYNKFIKTPSFILWKRAIMTFIHLMKANNIQENEFSKWISKSKKFYYQTIETQYLKLLQRIYKQYQLELAKNNFYDFDDLILKAIKIVKQCDLKYQYIIIDEYQDTSYTRYRLIQELIRKTGASLMAVGDDFQSIYRFTGCDLDIFLHFQEYFGYTEILKIQNTYRNSQQLIDLAGKFIMKNPSQMRKSLHSDKQLEYPIVICFYENFSISFTNLINQLDQNDIFILGRNHRDLNLILKDSRYQTSDKRNITNLLHPEQRIKFYTVHTSKGLEADVVIVINMTDQLLGFPTQVTDDPILKYVKNKTKMYPYDEERRLFYVALTRTKNKVYLFTPKKNPSCFIKEIIRDYKSKIEIKNMV